MSEKKIKLPSIGKVKKALYADWALRVKQRDGWKCLLCGCEDNLTAHHWYVSDHHAHAARYCVDNGATLCYACHIRAVHTRADYVTVMAVFNAIMRKPGFSPSSIPPLMHTELTTSLLRTMWDAMRRRPVNLLPYNVVVTRKGDKIFVTPKHPRSLAVVGNTIVLPGYRTCEVLVAAPSGNHYRYTVKQVFETE
jgi:hypothetical protein